MALRFSKYLKTAPDGKATWCCPTPARSMLWHELKMKRKEIERLADVAYHPKDIAATIASGSFLTEGMVIAPCSMKTLAAVAHAHADDLVSRAADVVLKERRRLVLVPRETPLNLAHLRNMAAATEMGAVIFPPVPAFYAQPKIARRAGRAQRGARARPVRHPLA